MSCGQLIQQECKRYSIKTTKKAYAIKVSSGAGWHWTNVDEDGESEVNVPVAVSVVTHDLFKKTISPIIFIDGSVYSWRKLGIVQDKSAGTLDFTNCAIGSEIQGDFHFQYKG